MFEEPKFTKEMHVELTRPFNPKFIKWRVGATSKGDQPKGMALAFVDARDVMKRLDTVIGPQYWQAKYPQVGMCEVSLYLGGQWIAKANCAGVTDVEAEKGQASDSFKRAAVLWGIARYLYYLPSSWVNLEQRGRSLMIPKGGEPQLPEFALPENWTKYYPKMFN